MSLIVVAGVLTLVALAAFYDRLREKRRRTEAALLEDSRYGEALELLWSRRGTPTPFRDAVDYLEQCGIPRHDAVGKLCRILGLDPALIDLGLARSAERLPERRAADPWARRPTPAISSSMLLPIGGYSERSTH